MHEDYHQESSLPENKQITIKDGTLNYQIWQGVRSFFCGGRIQIGPQPIGFVIVILLINVTNCASLGFSWRDYYIEENNIVPLVLGGILWLLTNIMMFSAALSDPGLIPK